MKVGNGIKRESENKSGGLTPNQKFLLRLRTFPKRALRVLIVLDGDGQVQSAVFEDAGKVERFG